MLYGLNLKSVQVEKVLHAQRFAEYHGSVARKMPVIPQHDEIFASQECIA
jgi:hypothetical protein